MWKEKLQDTAASHPWLEPHEAIKRKTQAPGMQLVDWYGFTVPKTKRRCFSSSPPVVKTSLLSARSTTSTLFSATTRRNGDRISYSMISTRLVALLRGRPFRFHLRYPARIRVSSCTKSRDLKPCRVAASPDGAIYSMRLTATWNMPTSSFSIAKPVIATA